MCHPTFWYNISIKGVLMSRKHTLIFIIILCVFIGGCKSTDTNNPENKKEEVVDEMDVFDFYFINLAEEATEKHHLMS